jgi:hypothetical protein
LQSQCPLALLSIEQERERREKGEWPEYTKSFVSFAAFRGIRVEDPQGEETRQSTLKTPRGDIEPILLQFNNSLLSIERRLCFTTHRRIPYDSWAFSFSAVS